MKKCDSFERRRAVLESVVEVFKDFRIDRKNFKGKRYILWLEAKGENKEEVFADLTMRNANGLTLNEEIIDLLFRKGFEIDSIELRHGVPEDNLDKIKQKEKEGKIKKKEATSVVIYLEEASFLATPQASTIVLKARLTLASGSPAALKQPEGYVIDSKHTPYNIGRVIEPGDATNRINHIEIIDETREYSSRSLAHIDYSEAVGFYIQREKPTETNPVEVIRKTEAKILKNESASVVLKDGDRLKLRHVMLDFHMITE